MEAIPSLKDLDIRWPFPKPSLESGFPGLPVIGTVSSERSNRTTTCPSFYKIEPPRVTDMSSVALLREFFARPDDDPGSSASTNDNRSQEPREKPRPRMLQKPQGGAVSDGPVDHISRFPDPNHTNNVADGRSSFQNFPHSSFDSSHPQGGFSALQSPVLLPKINANSVMVPFENFRCPDCNRRCKSETSFEKHKNSCTHRAGPLTLECRFCKRPYTYVGYLHKHEIECEKLKDVCGPSTALQPADQSDGPKE